MTENIQLWLNLWKSYEKTNLSKSRGSLYKLSLNKGFENNFAIKLIMTFCYSLSISYDLAINQLEELVKEEHPMLFLYIATVLLMKCNSFKTKDKEVYLNSAVHWFSRYLTEGAFSLEKQFNKARFFQFLGNERKAEEEYNAVIDRYFRYIAFHRESEPRREALFKASIYNKAVREIKNGNGAKAAKLLKENIQI